MENFSGFKKLCAWLGEIVDDLPAPTYDIQIPVQLMSYDVQELSNILSISREKIWWYLYGLTFTKS